MPTTTTEEPQQGSEQDVQTPEQAEGADEPVLGHIDEDTPIGRVFEFDPGGLEPHGGETAQLAGLSDTTGEAILDVDADHGTAFAIDLKTWNNDYAPKCTGYTDSPESTEAESGSEPPEAEQTKEPLIDDKQARAMFAARDVVKKADANVLNTKEELKEAKEALGVAQNRPIALIDEACTPNAGLPLFGDGEDEPAPGSEGEEDRAEDGDAESDEPESDAWRAVDLMSLTDPKIPVYVQATLSRHEPPIVTLGELVDWQAKKGDFWVKDIQGLGAAGAKKIEDATTAYWEREQKQGKG